MRVWNSEHWVLGVCAQPVNHLQEFELRLEVLHRLKMVGSVGKTEAAVIRFGIGTRQNQAQAQGLSLDSEERLLGLCLTLTVAPLGVPGLLVSLLKIDVSLWLALKRAGLSWGEAFD